jgi:hypothetical protein
MLLYPSILRVVLTSPLPSLPAVSVPSEYATYTARLCHLTISRILFVLPNRLLSDIALVAL